MPDPLRDACVNKDASWVAGWLSARLMVDVPVATVAGWLDRLADIIGDRDGRGPDDAARHRLRYTSGGWCDLWLRARLTEEDWFKPGMGYAPEIQLPVELHIGFLSVHETEEMLDRLRRRDDTPVPAGPATPGIERTQEVVSPIDRVAARVFGPDPGDRS